MRLHTLKPKLGARHRRKRVGRGESSGHGGTCGRGTKGQKSRTGASIPPAFEGGQMPLIRRIPKRGFNNARFGTVYIPVNVDQLNRFEDGTVVDEQLLRKTGLANGKADGIKILGRGELKRRLIIHAHAFSKAAKIKIEQAGGTWKVTTRTEEQRITSA